MKLVCVTLFASLIGCAVTPPTLSSDEQHDTGCVDENGDEIPCGPCPNPSDCVVTIDPPGDGDPCAVFPELCSPGNPDPCTVDPSSCSDPCTIDPSSCTGGGSGSDQAGVCPNVTKTETKELVGSDQLKIKQRAETAAKNAAYFDCSGDWYWLVVPSYCGNGESEGFSMHSNCTFDEDQPKDLQWDCSATASVTCQYTFHAF